MTLRIKVKRLDPDLPLPRCAHETDAGCDLYSRIDVVLRPGERILVPTGIEIAIPQGYAGFIQPRSGLALQHGISIVNSPGLIDSGYRGEVSVILINQDAKKTFRVRRGDKICQLVIQKVEKPEFQVVDSLDETERGKGGFGSSGQKHLTG
jgi:dUTP pyrophosphatase